MKISFLFLFVISFCSAQTKVSGRVVQAGSGVPVPFAGIGISGKPVGTLSGQDGSFEIIISESLLNDTIRVSAIGFRQRIMPVKDFIKNSGKEIHLTAQISELEEVLVKSGKIVFASLGSSSYSKSNCTGFVKNAQNWKGSEAAILAGNKPGRAVKIESFSFYIIQNKYEDSLVFRLMFYEASDKKFPKMKTFVRQSIIFKTTTRQGEFTLPLDVYNLCTDKDFFISLECLTDEMDISKFCYAGSYGTPAFTKSSSFDRWHKTTGGGADFKVKVSYTK